MERVALICTAVGFVVAAVWKRDPVWGLVGVTVAVAESVRGRLFDHVTAVAEMTAERAAAAAAAAVTETVVGTTDYVARRVAAAVDDMMDG